MCPINPFTAVAKPGDHDSQLVLEQVDGLLITQGSSAEATACARIAESRHKPVRLVTRSKGDIQKCARTYFPTVSIARLIPRTSANRRPIHLSQWPELADCRPMRTGRAPIYRSRSFADACFQLGRCISFGSVICCERQLTLDSFQLSDLATNHMTTCR